MQPLPPFLLPASKKWGHQVPKKILSLIPSSIRHNPTHLSNYHYPFLIFLGIFNFFMISSVPFIYRLGIYTALTLACVLPLTRSFFIPALPIFAWLVTYFGCRFYPDSARSPHIFVNVLATLERLLYGSSLSTALSSHPYWIFDLLAWLPYGILHFVLPFVTSLTLFWFGPPGTLPVFAHAFGYMNLAGVITQLLVPTAPPWYETLHGTQPATYEMSGSPAGLARVDMLLGINMYTSAFQSSPLVFGAFPSLHSGTASVQALFACWLFPKGWPFFALYVLWVWWATMYLRHHYLIDLVGGSMYAIITFFLARRWLPRKRDGIITRWGYPNGGESLLEVLRGERKSMRVHLEEYLEDQKDYEIRAYGKEDEVGLLEAEEIFILDEIITKAGSDGSTSGDDSGVGGLDFGSYEEV